jgi:hypothetical protein
MFGFDSPDKYIYFCYSEYYRHSLSFSSHGAVFHLSWPSSVFDARELLHSIICFQCAIDVILTHVFVFGCF